MSLPTPTMGLLIPRMAGGTPSDPRDCTEAGAPSPFELRRSSLVSWTVRIAHLADRIGSRAFPARLWSGVRGEGLAERTLNGWGKYCRLIPKHQEVVAGERARLRIAECLEQRKARVERFEVSRRAMQAAGRFIDEASDAQVHLNPACCWIRINEETRSERGSLSSSVLFFLVDKEIRGLRMNLEGQVLINELADYQPCTIRQWSRLSSLADGAQLTALVRHLAAIGLVACQ